MVSGRSWLVLCATTDEAGLWAYDRLRDRSSAPVDLVTDADLTGAAWDHRVGELGTTTELRLPDGRTLASEAIGATLDRLVFAPPAMTAGLAAVDREYGFAESSALLISWLAGLSGPVLDPPTTRGLGGAWRSPGEWAMVAADVGLGCVPVSVDSATIVDIDGSAMPNGTLAADPSGWIDWRPYTPAVEDAIVVGEVVFSETELDEPTRDALRRLARAADAPILGVALEMASARRTSGAMDRSAAWPAVAAAPRLRGATPLPDLRAAGEPLIDALIEQYEPRP